jgi:hypothetical protein
LAFNADPKSTSKRGKGLTQKFLDRTANALDFSSVLIREFLQASVFLARRNALTGVLLKKMRLAAMDWAITLRRWNMTILISRVELATAKRSPSF